MKSTLTRAGTLGAAILSILAVAAGPARAAPTVAEAAALNHLKSERQGMGLTGSDIGEVLVSNSVYSKHNGVTHVYLQQYYRGIEVWTGLVNVNIAADGRVISSGSRFVANIASLAGGQSARKSGIDAATAAAGHLKLKPNQPFHILERRGGANESVTLSDAGIALKPIEAKLVWLPVDGGAVRLAWSLEIEAATGNEWVIAFVDAETGASLGQHSLVVEDTARSIADAIARPAGSPSALASFEAVDSSAYRVFPIPLESPTDGDRQLISGAANPSASPFGWHDTNGAVGAEFTVTRGNNVHAYADRDNNNVPDPGSDPNGGAGLSFDFPLNLNARPADSQPAFVTNLFYWNNIVHDVAHNYGFDEAAGNFQVNNYGNGGLGNDDVRAEAQDGSGRNNANFGTPVDGFRPRMQMFEWRSATPNPITVHAPSPIAGTYFGPMAGFGESLVTTGPLGGTVALVNDGVGVTSDGCTPFAVAPGTIPLVDRGACNFTVKVKNAQNSGAAIAIVANNVAGPAVAMGGADPTVTIPSVMISLADATLFKANLPLNVTIADGTGGAPDRDSDLDAGVIAHEYGHGISNRLTGGPATVACLNNAEQMGEGWSDWFGMTLTADASDRPTTPRGVGTYVSFQPADGAGIRPTQYTTDMAVNPSTYASVADVLNISQPHGIGYVWNTMLWEVYWNLVDRYGFNPDIYGHWSGGGNNLAFQLVMDGMKMQPCRPGFVDGRNAILTADQALTGGANQCPIWRGFAKRGLGFSANQGSSNDRSDGVAAFDLPASCTGVSFAGFEAPIAAAPAVNAANAGQTIPVKFDLVGEGVITDIDSQPVDCETLEATGAASVRITPPGAAGLTMPQAGEYHVNWQTDAAWAGSCRRLTVRLPAAEDAVAFFSFR